MPLNMLQFFSIFVTLLSSCFSKKPICDIKLVFHGLKVHLARLRMLHSLLFQSQQRRGEACITKGVGQFDIWGLLKLINDMGL